jgi:nucleoside-diphosphate-sugar epimerase
MKILITGHTGFIGSSLTPILEKNHQVYCLQNDLLDFDLVTKEVLDYSPDIIVHLAARTEVEKSFYEQITFSQINYVGSVNLIEAASKIDNLKLFVFASTMEVYGWQPISDEVKLHGIPKQFQVFDEKTQPNPNAPYAVAKYAVEKYLEYAHRCLELPYTIIRQTNSYGRKDNNFFVTEQIICQMLSNPDEIYLGYAEPYRNFLYVDDLTDAWVKVINNPEVCNNKIFTLGPNNAIKIKDYAKIIANKINWQGKIIWDSKPKRPGEIYYLNSGYDLIYNTLGWQPSISMNEGLDKTIEIVKKQF